MEEGVRRMQRTREGKGTPLDNENIQRTSRKYRSRTEKNGDEEAVEGTGNQ